MTLFLLLLTSLLVVSLAYRLHLRHRHFQILARLGIPGPRPNVLYGNLRDLRFSPSKNVLDVMTEWGGRYGRIYGYYAGVKPTVIVEDLDLVKEILIKNAQAFINRPRMIVSTKPLTHTVVGLRGQRWKEVRSILTPTFSAAKMRQIMPLMSKAVSETLRLLEEEKGAEVEVLGLYQGLTCTVIADCALAMKVNCQRDKKDKFLTAVKGFLANALNPLVFAALCFPIVGYAIGKFVERFAISGQMTSMICENVEGVMRARREEKRLNDGTGGTFTKDKPVDVLQLMMDVGGASESEKRLSDSEVIANAWVFVLGGFETTACALSITTYLLTRHPEIQERLFEELQAAFAVKL
jgi:cytochrome P450